MMTKTNEKIRHAVGEIVIGELGNFFENPNATRKARPLVVLATGNCQHLVAGLTSREFYRTTGDRRVAIPTPASCGLNGPGYLWSPRPARVSRLDIRKHVGWVAPEMVQMLAEAMHLSPAVISTLWRAASRRCDTGHWHLSA